MLLLFLNESSPRQVGIGVRFDLVVLHATDGAIHFQNGQRDIMHVRDAMFTQGTLQFVHADMLSRHVRLNRLSIVNKKARFTLNYAPEAATGAGESTYHLVQQQQRGSRRNATNERGVRSGHGVLHGIGKQKQQCKIERCHLPDLALAAETHANQHDEVNDAGPQSDLRQDVPTCRKENSVQLAVTGVGALFGVLKYPVALFLSTDQTTSSNSKWSRPE